MILKYKNYTGHVKYDSEAKRFHGEIVGIRDVITFVSREEEGLQSALEDSIEDYIQLCRSKGKIPEKSCSGNLSLRIDPNIHAKIIAEAAYQGISLNSYIENKLSDK